MSRLQRIRADGEDGFALLFVLMVTTVIMLGVTTALVVTANNVIPARHSQDTTVATAAAEAGLQRYVAYLNAKCITFDSAACSNINGTPYSATVSGADSAGTATFTRQVLNPSTYLSDGFLRVKSTGFFSGGSRTLTADLIGKPNPLRFTYLSGYEAQGSAFLNSYYPARSIKVTTAAAVAAANNTTAVLSPGSVVTWNAPSAAPNGWDDSICDKLYYDQPGVPGRSTIKSTLRATMPIGADWAESGNDGTLYQPCETTFTTGQTFNGPMYTLDAPYLSYGLGGTVGTKGPVFKTPAAETYPPVSTGWAKTAAPGWSAAPYHSFPFIGGGPSSLSTTPNGPTSTIQNLPWSLTLPVNADPAKAGATCVYTGPTRITVSGATATIVSPLTATSAGACYANTDATITGTGITSAQVPVATTSIYVANAGDVTKSATASAASPIFSLAHGVADAASSATTTTPVWTKLWTANVACGTAVAPLPADQKNFLCELASAAPGGATSTWAGFKAKAAALLTVFTPTASLTADLKTVVDNTFAYYNTPWTNAAGAPTTGTLGQYRYVVTPSASDTTVAPATGCPVAPGTTTGLTNASLAAPTSDALLGQRTNGTESQTVTCAETQATSAVARQLYGCYVNASGFLDATTTNAGTCNGLETAKWSGGLVASAATSVAQFSVTASRYVQNTTYAVTAQGTSSFPVSGDITQYKTWDAGNADAPGDAYLEGTGITGRLSVIAQNDVIVTGQLTTSATTGTNAATGEPAWTGGGSLDVIGQNNVRIYHPVSCAVAADASTSAGFCPNDITGLYSGGLETNGVLAATHPAMQYCNLTAATTGGATAANTGNANCSALTAIGSGPVGEIDAAVFALNGSFLSDNYNRGVSLGSTLVQGGIYQQHRGPLGEQWESLATDTASGASGYLLQDNYLDMQSAGLPYVPPLTTTGDAWSIVSTSMAAS